MAPELVSAAERYAGLLEGQALLRLEMDLDDLRGAYRSGLVDVQLLVELQRAALLRAGVAITGAEHVAAGPGRGTS